MAEYNPSKIIKDGNTYNFRDTTKIPLTGSNQISGNLIPATTDAYDLGGSSYQWNNAYIKSLTINGVACGDILTHNASEFVDVTSGQTISGRKIFSNSQTGVGRDLYHFTSSPYSKNTPPENISYQYIWFGGNTASQGFANNWYSGYIEQRVYPNGSVQGRWSIRDTSESIIGIELFVNGSDKQFRPQGNNITDLGSSTNKWKSFNGINPGALSLPSISSTGANAWIALDTTDWIKNAATSVAQKYTPPADGWLNIRVNNAIMLGLAITGGGNYMHQMVRSETPNGLALLIPVFKNTEVAILVAGNENLAYDRSTFYPCQGNV